MLTTSRFLKRLIRSASFRYPVKRPLIWFTVLFYACLAAFIIAVTPARIAQFVYDVSQDLRHLPYGYMLLIVAMIVASFPPFIGHSMLLHLFGFTYGLRGVIYAAIGTLAGSVIVFVTLRMMFTRRLRWWAPTNEKWQALEAVIRSKGMPLIILVRMSSLVSWSWSNSLFASISSVSFTQFFIATLFVFPKVTINVAIGSRLARFSDMKQRTRMYARVMVLNVIIIVGGILLTALASALLYYFILKEVKRLRANPSERNKTGTKTFEAIEETPFSESTV
ncbi:Golgi apparatus membrane protein TVP38 [Suillus bovinus]|uniref:Golgi apparatus membrane protein TVP38 n=1 Tax=Suillus bovinus TaxID=48563 RepID=UPI001B865B2D|nr:Golgi apparatus membrane protein TVP38 [Suillus bovinus]KAG2157652.1 Golgi apparatus membrane protein TVP38 [Suillus bovinus]